MSQPVPPSALAWWNLFYLFLFFGVLAGGIVVAIMLYFIHKYRYREGQAETAFEPAPTRLRVREAVILTTISGVLLFSLAVVSYRTVVEIQYYPPVSESMIIQVTAFQWNFRFRYPNNVTTVGEVRVPSQTPVLFNVTSSDVMHNFGLPDFKLKIDAIPGMYNTLWITPPALEGNTELRYTIRCYELCGVGHSYMQASLIVIDPNAFTQWLNQMSLKQTG